MRSMRNGVVHTAKGMYNGVVHTVKGTTTTVTCTNIGGGQLAEFEFSEGTRHHDDRGMRIIDGVNACRV